ncbi:hypothetical protein N7532_001140 [Penicillium argentinense]|uniref:Uncharacterized protein n=1 Tax=Penicillium argentinense TaxID=1131581 RepID=A0A9W9G1Y0_9EURO|nr:uncharacterized protein N7532_001140 [Penicillium argentinense]KAJ5110605.1 hypothetical protein N7532_001140 [Penicillium argentinense]
MSLMETEYNSSYADELRLSLGDIAQFQSDWSNAEPIARTESLMCMGHNAFDVVSDAETPRGELCVLRCPTAGTKKWCGILQGSQFLDDEAKLLVSRNLEEEAEAYPSSGTGSEPSWGYMVQVIINGDLTLRVRAARPNQSWGTDSGNCGATSGQEHQLPEIPQDNYGMFHLHFEHLINNNGVWRPEIYAIVAFHGQQYNYRTRARVDGNNNEGEN